MQFNFFVQFAGRGRDGCSTAARHSHLHPVTMRNQPPSMTPLDEIIEDLTRPIDSLSPSSAAILVAMFSVGGVKDIGNIAVELEWPTDNVDPLPVCGPRMACDFIRLCQKIAGGDCTHFEIRACGDEMEIVLNQLRLVANGEVLDVSSSPSPMQEIVCASAVQQFVEPAPIVLKKNVFIPPPIRPLPLVPPGTFRVNPFSGMSPHPENRRVNIVGNLDSVIQKKRCLLLTSRDQQELDDAIVGLAYAYHDDKAFTNLVVLSEGHRHERENSYRGIDRFIVCSHHYYRSMPDSPSITKDGLASHKLIIIEAREPSIFAFRPLIDAAIDSGAVVIISCLSEHEVPLRLRDLCQWYVDGVLVMHGAHVDLEDVVHRKDVAQVWNASVGSYGDCIVFDKKHGDDIYTIIDSGAFLQRERK